MTSTASISGALQHLISEHYDGLPLWASESSSASSVRYMLGDASVAPDELLPVALHAVYHNNDGLLKVSREEAHEIGLCTPGTDCAEVHWAEPEALAAGALRRPDGHAARLLVDLYTSHLQLDDDGTHPLEVMGRAFECLTEQARLASLRDVYAALRTNTFRHPMLSQLVSSTEALSYYRNRAGQQLLALCVYVPGGHLALCANLPASPDESHEELLRLVEQWCTDTAADG